MYWIRPVPGDRGKPSTLDIEVVQVKSVDSLREAWQWVTVKSYPMDEKSAFIDNYEDD